MFSRFIEKQQSQSFANSADTRCKKALFHGRTVLSIDVMCGFTNHYTGDSVLDFITKAIRKQGRFFLLLCSVNLVSPC